MSGGEVDLKKGSRRRLNAGLIFGLIFASFVILVTLSEPDAIPYRVVGALNGAIFGAIGGGLGAISEFALKKRWGTSALTFGAIVGFLIGQSVDQGAQTIGNNFFQNSVKPRVDRAIFERQLVNNPDSSVFRTIRDYDPDRFRKIVDELVNRARTGESTETTINYVRKNFVEPIFSERAAYLSDDLLIRYIRLVANELRVYSLRKPELCVFAMRGQALGDVRPYLTKELVAQEQVILEETIKLKRSSLPPLYAEAEMSKLVEGIVLKLTQKHGDKVKLLDPSTTAKGSERLVCEVGSDYFEEIAALPKAQAAQLMRTFLVSGSR